VQWVGSQRANLVRKFGAELGKLGPLSGRQIEHLHSLAAQPDLIQQPLGVFDSAFGVEITFQVMALALQSAGDHHTIGAVFKGI
jgi:hypothetical protein